VTSFDNKIKDWKAISEKVMTDKEVVAAAPYVDAEAMLSNQASVSGTIVRGIIPELEPGVSDIHEHMQFGKLTDLVAGEYGIVLGSGLAANLDVSPGDRVTMITPQSRVSPVGFLPRLRRFKVVGIFEIGVYEYDRSSALIHAEDASKLFRMNGAMSGVRLKIQDMDRAPTVRHDLREILGVEYWVSDWTLRHSNYFKAVQTEKTVMFIILSLIVAVAAFNIVSTLVMVVTDKQADIAILRTLGLSPSSVTVVFMIQGTLIGLFGTLLGVFFGVLVASNVSVIIPALEQFFHTQFLPTGVYPITELPSKMEISDVLRIGIMSFVLSILATIYPALRASKTQPAEALRYE
jgi:lipoprotein-releasing system permease protein